MYWFTDARTPQQSAKLLLYATHVGIVTVCGQAIADRAFHATPPFNFLGFLHLIHSGKLGIFRSDYGHYIYSDLANVRDRILFNIDHARIVILIVLLRKKTLQVPERSLTSNCYCNALASAPLPISMP